MKSQARNWLIGIVILIFLFVLFSAYLFPRLAGVTPTPPPLPNPNGYDDLLKAGAMLVNDTNDDEKIDAEQLRKIVSADMDALALARAGMNNECRVPIQYSQSYISNHLDDLGGLKQLARAFVAEGLLAEKEGRNNAAIQSFMDTVRLGSEAMRGGVLIDGLVGIAINAMGTAHLQTLVPHLDASACRETTAALETLDAQSPTLNDVMHSENLWRNAIARLQKRSITKIEQQSFQKSDRTYRLKFNMQLLKKRQLIIALAAHAYELDKGHPPANVSDLAPGYLKEVPKDPVTGTNMIYFPR